MMGVLKTFFADRRANLAVTMAVLGPLLLAAVGFATDIAMVVRSQSNLQRATDGAALATVKEMAIPNVSDAQLESVFKNHFFTNAGIAPENEGDYIVKVTSVPGKSAVLATVELHWKPLIAQFIDKKATPITAAANAEMAGQGLTCVIGLLQPTLTTLVKSSLHFGDASKLIADNCSVFSNSNHAWGLRADGDAEITAQLTCSAGGILKLGKAKFTPDPVKDCPQIEDPLEKRAAPIFGACTENNAVINVAAGVTTNIKPGVYCDGLRIEGEGSVELDPGIYVIKSGPLVIAGSVSVIGKGVGFYLTGTGSVFNFGPDAGVDLAAPATGPMAGLLVFEDRAVPYSFNLNPLTYEPGDLLVRMHRISSNRANNLLGTLYLSRSVLRIDSTAPVADKSAYTALIVGRLWLQKGLTLTLNADYTKTTVPVPDGLIGTRPKLIH